MLPFFEVPGCYPAMINKIAISTFLAWIIAIVILRKEFVWFDVFLRRFYLPIPLGGVSIPLGTVLPALVLALIGRIFALHEMLSDLFRIRARFDVSAILVPLASGSRSMLTHQQFLQLTPKREYLMDTVFYTYASCDGKSAIEPLLIKLALDKWCSFWMVLEASFVAVILCLTLLIMRRSSRAAIVSLALLGLLGLLPLIYHQCALAAHKEVVAILSDPGRLVTIAAVFRHNT
jgi:hypothetical protein